MNDAILADDFLAQDATYTPAGGAAKPIRVIFSNEYSAPEGAGIIGVSSSVPVAICKTSDVSGVARDDTLALVVDGATVTYKIKEFMPDGTGMTTLLLSRD